MRRLVLLAWLLAPGVAAAAPPEPRDADLAARALEALDEWQVEEAVPLVQRLVAEHKDDPVAVYVDGYLRFLLGDYDEAEKRIDDAIQRVGDRVPQTWRTLRQIAAATADVTRGFVRLEGEHFVIVYPPGAEEVLAPWALEALEAAREHIGADLGFTPRSKIRVEIYRETDDLARVSTLTKKEIEASGTIALCKFNRLMIVSPGALVRGYAWLDTLAHEYTHFVVSARSRNTVPIWLHEGIAKYFERRWRGPAGGAMPGYLEALLAAAVKKNDLVTFEQMHPSMAKLPTQERAALAFAEVYTAVEYLREVGGPAAVTAVIDKMAEGKSDQRAVGEVIGGTFQGFEKGWRKFLQGRKVAAAAPAPLPRLRFKKPGRKPGEDDEADVGSLPEKTAQKHARLGGMLRARGRSRAAALEYERALAALGGASRETGAFLAAKLARTYLELGEVDKARAAVQPALEVMPDASSPNLTMAEALLRAGDAKAARPYLEAALRQNPFDPAVHCGLEQVFSGLGDQPRRERAEAACRRLRG